MSLPGPTSRKSLQLKALYKGPPDIPSSTDRNNRPLNLPHFEDLYLADVSRFRAFDSVQNKEPEILQIPPPYSDHMVSDPSQIYFGHPNPPPRTRWLHRQTIDYYDVARIESTRWRPLIKDGDLGAHRNHPHPRLEIEIDFGNVDPALGREVDRKAQEEKEKREKEKEKNTVHFGTGADADDTTSPKSDIVLGLGKDGTPASSPLLHALIDTDSSEIWFWKVLQPDCLFYKGTGTTGIDVYKAKNHTDCSFPAGYWVCFNEEELRDKGSVKIGPTSDQPDSAAIMLARYGSWNAVAGHYYRSNAWLTGADNLQKHCIPAMITGHAVAATGSVITAPSDGVIGLAPSTASNERPTFLDYAVKMQVIEERSFFFDLYGWDPTRKRSRPKPAEATHSQCQSRFIIGELPCEEYPDVQWFPVSLIDEECGEMKRWSIEIDSYTIGGKTYELEGDDRHFICDTAMFGNYGPDTMMQHIYGPLRGVRRDSGAWMIPSELSHDEDNLLLFLNPAGSLSTALKFDVSSYIYGPGLVLRDGEEDRNDYSWQTTYEEWKYCVFQGKGNSSPETGFLGASYPFSTFGMCFLQHFAMFFDHPRKRIGFASKKTVENTATAILIDIEE